MIFLNLSTNLKDKKTIVTKNHFEGFNIMNLRPLI